ncbi:uncharacterized protein LOC135345397 [Halichondria panicea]|uniref:uncharacterized protein LOC135345397 n=1 Tax=Halichondria panicea TaxID=6063 RepID=UPI00312B9C2B
MVCFIIALIFLLHNSNAQGIISFNQSAAAVPPNVNMTFYCEATGISVYLEINDVPLFDIRDSSGIYSQRQNYAGLWVLSVAIQANSTNNKTKITCFVDTNHKEDRYLIVAGPPSNPLPRLGYNNHNHSLTLNWNEPFTHPGFNVIRYTLEIMNTANHETISEPIDMQLRRVYMYTSILPVMCTELEYTVTAYNEVGNSTASVTGGFPIDIAPVEIQSRVLYQGNGSPHLEIWFEPAYSCSFQVVNYTVYLEESIEETVLLNYCDNRYSVHSGLSSGANYTVVVEAESIAGLTVTKKKVAILEQKLEGLTTSSCLCTAEYGQEMLTYQIISGALAAFFAILAVLMIIVLSLYCRQCRLQKKKKIKNALRGTVATPTIPQRPLSLQTKCAATNPIYEGPLYESPGGEPLRTLLGSTPSTPNTPLDSPRYTFDMLPPSLPPPRKASTYSVPYDTPDIASLHETQKLDFSNIEMPKTARLGDEYTVMRPANVRTGRKSRPSPLVIPSLTTLPEV